MKLRMIPLNAVKGKRVLVRIDANVEIKNDRVVDGPRGRIARSAEGIRRLQQAGARVVVLSHLGRPTSASDTANCLRPVAKRLSALLKTPVRYDGSLVGPSAKRLVDGLKNGDVALLENLRFDRREEKNDRGFAKALAELGDLYVDDAFAVAHRAHASVSAITKLLPSFAGPLMVEEVKGLSQAMGHPKKPYVLVLGGAKMETKIGLVERLGPAADHVCVGGALANTFLAAMGVSMGTSRYEKTEMKTAKRLLKRFGNKMVLPMDFRLNGTAIEDAGPATTKEFVRVIASAKTIVWNGPLGRTEHAAFTKATRAIAQAIAKSHATTIVGGGDTLPLMEKWKLADAFTLLSTGGGAMLAFLSGDKMPGIEPLMVKR